MALHIGAGAGPRKHFGGADRLPVSNRETGAAFNASHEPGTAGARGSGSDDIPTSKQDASAPAVAAVGLSHF